ncbi:MAG: cell wall hydrolase, partial [Alphaproteobacteria bacterium]
TDIVFCICKRIAGRAVAGLLEDKTNGATHYHTRHVWPDWAKGKIPCAEIGRHFFYNDIEK